MRVVAALRRLRSRIPALVVASLIVAAALVAAAAPVLGADPTADPTADPGTGGATRPTCAERYPEEGPAGVDLRLGCIVGEVVGQYTGSVGQEATPASTYGLIVLGILVSGFVLIWLVGRFVGRAAGRRLAPVQPGEWWLCGTCRSVNGAGVQHCYSCGARSPDDPGPTLRTDDAPSTVQSFGSTRKRG